MPNRDHQDEGFAEFLNQQSARPEKPPVHAAPQMAVRQKSVASQYKSKVKQSAIAAGVTLLMISVFLVPRIARVILNSTNSPSPSRAEFVDDIEINGLQKAIDSTGPARTPKFEWDVEDPFVVGTGGEPVEPEEAVLANDPEEFDESNPFETEQE